MSARETFRERLASIAFDAVISRECESECEHGTAALAVYTAAVRDVLADIEREFDPRLSSWLREWAAERGISLEGSGDELA